MESVCVHKPVRYTVFISLSRTAAAVYLPLTSGREHQPPTPVSCLHVVGCFFAPVGEQRETALALEPGPRGT